MPTAVTPDAEAAAARLRDGGLVAFPTETVYGLGADATDAPAVARIFQAKGRPDDNPLIVHLPHPDLAEVARSTQPYVPSLVEAFMPGPVTLVVPRRAEIPDIVTAGLDTVGVRVPGLQLARDFLAACGCPVAAPSANRSGRPSPTAWRHVLEDLEGRVDVLLQGPDAKVGLESTVIDCTGPQPEILRQGAIDLEALRAVVPGAILADRRASLARSPGTRHRHYAPAATVVLVDTVPSDPLVGSAYVGLQAPKSEAAFVFAHVPDSLESYARDLFGALRRADAEGASRIYCQRVGHAGLGAALMDRLRRAAEG